MPLNRYWGFNSNLQLSESHFLENQENIDQAAAFWRSSVILR